MLFYGRTPIYFYAEKKWILNYISFGSHFSHFLWRTYKKEKYCHQKKISVFIWSEKGITPFQYLTQKYVFKIGRSPAGIKFPF